MAEPEPEQPPPVHERRRVRAEASRSVCRRSRAPGTQEVPGGGGGGGGGGGYVTTTNNYYIQ